MVTVIDVDMIDRTPDTDTGARLTIGRTGVRDQGAAGYLQATITTRDPRRIIAAGAVVELRTDRVLRHTGTVTDVDLTHESPAEGPRLAVQQVTAMGPLSEWGRRWIGDEPWPVETVADRARRLAALAGTPLIVQGGTTQLVTGRDVDRRRAGELLADLAESTGGWLFDYAGVVYLQALDARRVAPATLTWADEPAAAAWQELDAGTPWHDDDTGTIAPPLLLPCDAIDWQPVWSQTSEVVNTVTVEYGIEESVTVTDTASIDVHGPCEAKVSTVLASRADALTLAGVVLARAAWPQWELSAVTVPYDIAGPELRRTLDTMRPGARMTVTGLPQPAPASGYPGVVEGWRETFELDRTTGGTLRTFTIALSHVSHSMAVPTWEAQPPAATWQDLDPATTWETDL